MRFHSIYQDSLTYGVIDVLKVKGLTKSNSISNSFPDSHQINACWHNHSCAISWEASNFRIVMTNNLQPSFAIYILSFGLIYCIGNCFAPVSYVFTLLTITALHTGLRPRFSHYLCMLCVLIFYPWCAQSNMEFLQNNFRPYFYFHFLNVRSEVLFQEISSFHYFLL